MSDVKSSLFLLFVSVTPNREGKVYSWGRNDFGQLGHGDNEHLHTPKA